APGTAPYETQCPVWRTPGRGETPRCDGHHEAFGNFRVAQPGRGQAGDILLASAQLGRGLKISKGGAELGVEAPRQDTGLRGRSLRTVWRPACVIGPRRLVRRLGGQRAEASPREALRHRLQCRSVVRATRLRVI